MSQHGIGPITSGGPGYQRLDDIETEMNGTLANTPPRTVPSQRSRPQACTDSTDLAGGLIPTETPWQPKDSSVPSLPRGGWPKHIMHDKLYTSESGAAAHAGRSTAAAHSNSQRRCPSVVVSSAAAAAWRSRRRGRGAAAAQATGLRQQCSREPGSTGGAGARLNRTATSIFIIGRPGADPPGPRPAAPKLLVQLRATRSSSQGAGPAEPSRQPSSGCPQGCNHRPPCAA